MIALFTDFGFGGPYTGQMKAMLYRCAPGMAVIDLFADAPAFDPQAAAYLLAAHVPFFPRGTVFLSVIDPGVGSDRHPIIVQADEYWFVGPDNGLFEPVLRRCIIGQAWRIEPTRVEGARLPLSRSFHGRDLFAPTAAMLANGKPPPGVPLSLTSLRRLDWPDELDRIVYIDHYGNAATGLRAALLPEDCFLQIGDQKLARAETFASVPRGAGFWYENSNGLAEIAVNQGSAAEKLQLSVGTQVEVVAA